MTTAIIVGVVAWSAGRFLGYAAGHRDGRAMQRQWYAYQREFEGWM